MHLFQPKLISKKQSNGKATQKLFKTNKVLHIEYSQIDDLSVEGRRLKKWHIQGTQLLHSNFKKTKLKNFSLSSSDLRFSTFSESKVKGLAMRRVNLSSCYLNQSYLYDSEFLSVDLSHVIANKCHIRKMLLEDARILNADFTNAKIIDLQVTDGNFTLSSFKEAVVNGSDFLQSKFHKSDFNKAHIKNTKFNKVDFTGSNMNQALFKDCNLIDIDLTMCDMSGASFVNTSVSNVLFQGMLFNDVKSLMASISKVAENKDKTSKTKYHKGRVIKDGEFAQYRGENQKFEDVTLEKTTSENSSFIGTEINDSKLKSVFIFGGTATASIIETSEIDSLSFHKVEAIDFNINECEAVRLSFIACDLDMFQSKNSQIKSSLFNSTKGMHSDFSEAIIQKTEFSSCDLSSSNFENTVFKNCTFESVDLSDCNLSYSSFIDCDFKNVKFKRAVLVGINDPDGYFSSWRQSIDLGDVIHDES